MIEIQFSFDFLILSQSYRLVIRLCRLNEIIKIWIFFIRIITLLNEIDFSFNITKLNYSIKLPYLCLLLRNFFTCLFLVFSFLSFSLLIFLSSRRKIHLIQERFSILRFKEVLAIDIISHKWLIFKFIVTFECKFCEKTLFVLWFFTINLNNTVISRDTYIGTCFFRFGIHNFVSLWIFFGEIFFRFDLWVGSTV